jgi:hypothetical protein
MLGSTSTCIISRTAALRYLGFFDFPDENSSYRSDLQVSTTEEDFFRQCKALRLESVARYGMLRSPQIVSTERYVIPRKPEFQSGDELRDFSSNQEIKATHLELPVVAEGAAVSKRDQIHLPTDFAGTMPRVAAIKNSQTFSVRS